MQCCLFLRGKSHAGPRSGSFGRYRVVPEPRRLAIMASTARGVPQASPAGGIGTGRESLAICPDRAGTRL